MYRLNVRTTGMLFAFVLVTVLCIVFGCTVIQKIYYRLEGEGPSVRYVILQQLWSLAKRVDFGLEKSWTCTR